eukprot:CAMPEP_0201488552 /NCGR_PEP_ID=MMETSP0151_2-20130828/18877_1 /ASSEMBLY_ACC=CAM_ASM_000257 /TAXON_ID=200890 /ORGANISM="Paramoeba atlantica, Strain 621/1 / CCAP 1560/9" /LENGTH=268 /DNA_ID=CAMNT_0047873867 /DNA_START=39 /DNA_END=842 /DNA_ORIENTATION=-
MAFSNRYLPLLFLAVSSCVCITDHTYLLNSSIPTYTGVNDFYVEVVTDFPADAFATRVLQNFSEHLGTHVDAPYHFGGPGKKTVDQISLDDLTGPLCVVDVSAQAEDFNDYALTVEDLEDYEHQFGKIPSGAIVAMYSGWGSRWPDVAAYRNLDNGGVMRFPGFSVEAVNWIIENRPDVVGLAVDTLSLDIGSSTTFEAHLAWAAVDKWGLENLAHLDQAPFSGVELTVAPIYVQDGTGSSARALSHSAAAPKAALLGLLLFCVMLFN